MHARPVLENSLARIEAKFEANNFKKLKQDLRVFLAQVHESSKLSRPAHYQQAVGKILKSLIAQNKDDAELYQLRGRFQRSIKDFNGAKISYERAIQLHDTVALRNEYQSFLVILDASKRGSNWRKKTESAPRVQSSHYRFNVKLSPTTRSKASKNPSRPIASLKKQQSVSKADASSNWRAKPAQAKSQAAMFANQPSSEAAVAKQPQIKKMSAREWRRKDQ